MFHFSDRGNEINEIKDPYYVFKNKFCKQTEPARPGEIKDLLQYPTGL